MLSLSVVRHVLLTCSWKFRFTHWTLLGMWRKLPFTYFPSIELCEDFICKLSALGFPINKRHTTWGQGSMLATKHYNSVPRHFLQSIHGCPCCMSSSGVVLEYKGFLRSMFKPNTDFIQCLFSKHQAFKFSFFIQ